MNRRDATSALIALGVAAGPFRAFAQRQPAGIQRIGLLALGGQESGYAKSFLNAMRGHGYVVGKNFLVEDRTTVGLYEQLPQAAKELVDINVNVIVCWGNTAILAVSKATSTIPIVMGTTSINPIAAGLTTELARPSRNVTGIISLQDYLVTKRMELLKEILPNMKRLGVLMNPGSSSEVNELDHAIAIAPQFGLEIIKAVFKVPSDIGPAISNAKKANVDALMAMPSSMLITHQPEMATAAMASRLPTIFIRSSFVESGGLMSYAANLEDTIQRTAYYVDKILKGAKPADLPIEQPTRFELAINLKTAKALGLKIPQSVLIRADRVIE